MSVPYSKVKVRSFVPEVMVKLLRSIFVDEICYILNKRIFRLLKVKRYQLLLKHSIVHGCCFTISIFLWSFLQNLNFLECFKISF